jgi:hypothetical protein
MNGERKSKGQVVAKCLDRESGQLTRLIRIALDLYRLVYCTYSRWFSALYDDYAPEQAKTVMGIIVGVNISSLLTLVAGNFFASFSGPELRLFGILVAIPIVYIQEKWLIGPTSVQDFTLQATNRWSDATRLGNRLGAGVLVFTVAFFVVTLR